MANLANLTEQFWRLLVSHLAFANSSDLLFGGLMIYHMRVIERHFGTAKYAVSS
jgi:membrane associated rhomboid family serine protease